MHSFIATFLPNMISIMVNIIFGYSLSILFEFRTGLTACGLLPLIIFSQIIQVKLVESFSEQKDDVYNNSVQIVKESVMNIRTAFSLGAPPIMQERYNQKLTLLD